MDLNNKKYKLIKKLLKISFRFMNSYMLSYVVRFGLKSYSFICRMLSFKDEKLCIFEIYKIYSAFKSKLKCNKLN